MTRATQSRMQLSCSLPGVKNKPVALLMTEIGVNGKNGTLLCALKGANMNGHPESLLIPAL